MSAKDRLPTGFTLIELVIYVTLLTIITLTGTFLFLGVFRSALAVRAEKETVTNLSLALKATELEVRHADAAYTSTSVFDASPGQLSLRTPRLAPTGHPFAYVDFYLDNGVLYERRDDDTGSIALTSGDISVSAFLIERFVSGNAEGVRITLTGNALNISSRFAEPKTLRTFVALRLFNP